MTRVACFFILAILSQGQRSFGFAGHSDPVALRAIEIKRLD